MSSFAHLHLHTEYSMLDGAARVRDVVKAVADDGQPAVAITDHGVMYGVVDFYAAARDAGVKPIIGMEAYVALESRFDRERGNDRERYHHMTLLAETDEGFKNLMKLSSQAFLDGYWYKPRLDRELLSRHSRGLIGTTGCLSGKVNKLILEGRGEEAAETASDYRDIFGAGNFFVEWMDHGLAPQHKANAGLLEISSRLDLPLLGTNDSHYAHKADALNHDALLCIQTGATIDQKDRLKFDYGDGTDRVNDNFYVKTASEMRELFKDHPDACDNTLLVAERCNVEIDFSQTVLPHFAVPEGHDEASYLREITFEGARRRWGSTLPAGATERLEYELRVISEMGFPGYFLVVWDLVAYAKNNGIRVGPGRGSAGGCAVAYCLGIVDVDPLEHGLIFERFLNPGRKEMPDIDMDFDERYRGEMIKYAAEKYGADHVAQIITFSTIKARAAVRDAARVLGFPYGLGDKIAKMMPPLVMGRSTPLKACLEKTPGHEESFKIASDLRTSYEAEPDVKRIVDTALGLEELRRQDSIHAAAVVITREPLTEYLPIQRKGDDAEIVTQFELSAVEKLGLLKMDFLGLRNLSVIESTLDMLRSRGVEVEIDDLDLNDEATFEMLRKGDSIGVFQLEGGQMRSLLRGLKPTSLNDIAAVIALYRPGPMANIPHYVDRKHGREAVTYLHPDLEPILKDTYGVLVYQESVIEIASRIAGFDMPAADAFRKAVGKKITALVQEQKVKFLEGCAANGYDRGFSEALFALIEPFADYGFNKAHAFGYALISYQTAFLKANYPAEYLAALLTSVKEDKDKTAIYLAECRSMGIQVNQPDVNASDIDFTVVDGVIVYGLSAVRNIGEGVVQEIMDARVDGPFTDFHDFCKRVGMGVLNKRVIESAVKAGAFDSLGYARKGLFDAQSRIIEQIVAKRKREGEGQFSLFDGGDGEALDQSVTIPSDEWERSQQLAFEREMLGLYVSDHPLLGVGESLRAYADANIADLREMPDGAVKSIAGVVSSLKHRFTKRGEPMASFVLEDLTGAIEVVCFPKVARVHADMLREDEVVLVTGRLDMRDDDVTLIVDGIERPDFSKPPPPERGGAVTISLTSGGVANGGDMSLTIKKLKGVLGNHPGETPVLIRVIDGETTKVLRVDNEFWVERRQGLYAELQSELGNDATVS